MLWTGFLPKARVGAGVFGANANASERGLLLNPANQRQVVEGVGGVDIYESGGKLTIVTFGWSPSDGIETSCKQG